MLSIHIICKETSWFSNGYERNDEGDGWYIRGSRAGGGSKTVVHSLHESAAEANEVLGSLKPGVVREDRADPCDQTSPVDYRKTVRYFVREVGVGAEI